MVAVPDGEDPKEWVAVHAVDFFNRISLIYGTLSDQCNRNTCTSMTHTNGTKVRTYKHLQGDPTDKFFLRGDKLSRG